jgi:hypothetical protein
MNVLNLTAELERLITHIVGTMPEFSHIEPSRLLVCIATTRGGGIHGVYAKIHPLRFAGGVRTTRIRRGRKVVNGIMPTITHRGIEILYLVYFLVPRFFNLAPREKLITIFHELYHISPACNGDIRRFPGRNYAHGSSAKRYNALMATFVDAYLAKQGTEGLPRFLQGDMEGLRAHYRVIVGRRMKAPRIECVAG